MSKYIKERFLDFSPYTPGEQPAIKNLIKLNTNESPYPPGPRVIAALKKGTMEGLRLYPSPDQSLLKGKLAEAYSEYLPGLSRENVFVSNGSDDILNFAFLAYTSEGKGAVYPDISYGFYKVFAEFQGVNKIEIKLRDDFTISPDDYKPENYMNKIEGKGDVGLVVLANPNAPTGIALDFDQVEEIIKSNRDKVVLIDEAYVDFGGETVLPLIEKYDNLIVSRTYSKSASLAGARLGFAFGNKELMKDLEVVKYSTNPYSVNSMTELTGLAVLEEAEYYRENQRKIIETREWTKDKLEALGLKVLPSKANFLFVGTGKEASGNEWKDISGEELQSWLKERGILVRWFNKERIKDYLRITIGKREDMEVLVKELKEKGEGRSKTNV